MPNLYRRWSSFLSFLNRLLGVEEGEFVLVAGQHNVTVPVSFFPDNVWVSLEGCGDPVCGSAGTNVIGWTIGDGEITFFVNVKTNECKVKWFATC